MANFIAMALVRDVHLRELARRGAAAARARRSRASACTRATRRTSRSRGRSTSWASRPRRSSSLPTDDRFRLHAEPVAEAIAADRARGLLPVAVVRRRRVDEHGLRGPGRGAGRARRREGLWLHVDAAYGGAARLSERDAARVPGLELADSVTVDPHKWFFQAYDIGALLVRDGAHLRQTFDRSPEYYRGGESPARRGRRDGHDDAHAGQLNFYKLGFEGTRRFRALKLWATWKHLGTSGLGRLVEMNDDIAAYLAQPCAEADDLEALPAEPELSVVCFRHLPGGRGRGRRDGRARARRATRTGSRPRSRRPAMAGCRRRASGARRGCAPAS